MGLLQGFTIFEINFVVKTVFTNTPKQFSTLRQVNETVKLIHIAKEGTLLKLFKCIRVIDIVIRIIKKY